MPLAQGTRDITVTILSCKAETGVGDAGPAQHPLSGRSDPSPTTHLLPAAIPTARCRGVAWTDLCQPSAMAAAGRRHLGAPQHQAGVQPGVVRPPGTLAPLPRSCRLPARGVAWSSLAPLPHSRAPAQGAPTAPAPPSLAWLAPCPAILRL